MTNKKMIAVDGNEACASVAYRTSEVVAIYPITPSSTMGELADEWAAKGKKNIWGVVPSITEMQSEAGAAGAVHGALQAGALSTTFTASQGLLLMIPNMYKIAGELTPFVMHVTARTIATHALSIFGDHSDVMACRQTGFAMLSGASVQEAQDLAMVATAATLKTRVPFLHFFDGFRTSHEVAKIESLSDDHVREMVPEALIAAHRSRALTPDAPMLRGSAQNPDAFFQGQEARNPFYITCADAVQEEMDKFAGLTGRAYKLFDYVGHPEAERIIIMMGSGCEAVHKTVEWLVGKGEKVGLIKVRLFRPFSTDALLAAMPASTRSIAVMDRCKEPGSLGEPLYMDIVTALWEARAAGQRATVQDPVVIGGRYGLASKEFTPAMVKAIYAELAKDGPKRHFTVGINDDVTKLSLDVEPEFDFDPASVKRAVFFGLGADGTVGANKNSIKIIADNTDLYAQGYFVYDSKKSGAVTISHLRFADAPIKSTYLIHEAEFVACHHFVFLERYDVLKYAAHGSTFLLNAPYSKDELWDKLPRSVQQTILDKQLKLYTIDARSVARDTGMGGRINTIMQTCFFALSGVLPRDEAIAQIKQAIAKTYHKKGEEVVTKNWEAVDQTLSNLYEVIVPGKITAESDMVPPVPNGSPDFVERVTGMMLAGKGDLLPVSAFPPDGTWPTGTAKFEKRNIGDRIPVWEPELCIQCNKCTLVCPHAAIRVKCAEPALLGDRPASFKSMSYKGAEFKGQEYLLQVAPEDCTGCNLCAAVCPGKDKKNPDRFALRMEPQLPLREQEAANWDFFLSLPEVDRTKIAATVKGVQFAQPLFEFSGACLGCGETPYIKMITQMWGDRTLIANATGCSSIFGGNLPTTPYTTDANGRGPAWANSLFEDNAEFGLGFRLALDSHVNQAKVLLGMLAADLPERLVNELIHSAHGDETAVAAQRARVVELRGLLSSIAKPEARRLETLANYLVEKVVWIMGGDGWAYDIGYGGLDHVIASGRNVNLLVMDTEVYSNTGGQASKATPIGAAAKFAVAGKALPKKDLGMMAMAYGNVYVASVAFGSKDAQTVRALTEAASYDGPSLVLAYSHCIAHGYEMADALDQQKMAVTTGYWPLFRYDPRKLGSETGPLTLDSAEPSKPLWDYMQNETRFRVVEKQNPEAFRLVVEGAEKAIRRRYAMLKRMADAGEQAAAAVKSAAE